jgi:hypothetical protein
MMFKVFKSRTGQLVVVGDNNVYEESISPQKMEEVMQFEADGISDFNQGMITALLKHGQDSPEKNKAKKIFEDGL